MKSHRYAAISSGLLEKARTIRLRAVTSLRNHADYRALHSLGEVRNYVIAVHELLGQCTPSEGELNAIVLRALARAGSVNRLLAEAASGRLAQVIEVRPLKIEMDILNKCNLRCPMCMMSDPSHYKKPLQRMSVEVFERLAADIFWHVQSLSFTYGAEPLLHPQFSDFVEIASRYRIPKIYAVTNGTLLTEAVARAIVKHGMHALAVSIDAVRPQTYSKIRVGGDWDSLMRNLQNFQRIKGELGSQRPYLELTFVMMKSNIEELPGFVDLAAELGATAVNATHMVPFKSLAIEHESCSHLKNVTNAMLARARERAEKLGLQFTGPPPFNGVEAASPGAQVVQRFDLPDSQITRKTDRCPFPWSFAAIDMHGDVVPCGWWHHQPGMGNIRSESFLSIWNNEKYRRLRTEHETKALRATCRTCPAAGTGCVDGDSSFLER